MLAQTPAPGANGSWRCRQEQRLGFLLPDPAGAADPTGGSLGFTQFPIRVIPRTPAEKMVQIYHPYAFLREKSELEGPSVLALSATDQCLRVSAGEVRC